MFDIGFFELLIIAIVGLVVIGPERLPEAARAVGLWIGRLKRSLRDTRSELERQLGADDIRRQLHNEEVMRSLEATRMQVEDAVNEGGMNKPKRQYREEPELPDHAHSEEQDRSKDTAESSAHTRDTQSGEANTAAEPAQAPETDTAEPDEPDTDKPRHPSS
ncbi:Sec-independent protein translocase protein TatB [Marinimicrobium agarilyticum]|uniref:Sec-independent protein translocase protein TatB n=1 Tax=Marinimicrobium agarilyticum TaxID=306546 RepID=UPI00042952E0|nr:Sec-independent protein translocase protein TatB [Marinimicrobium agarilyticum]